MPIISDWIFNTPDGMIPAGEVVRLTDEEEADLVQKGLAVWADEESVTGAAPSDVPPEDQEEDEEEWPTVEAFAAAKAEEQKELLLEAGIEPASNGPERLKQYEAWLQEDGGAE
ncbi:hypothetical protein ACDZ28_04040 [Paenibacillus sp. RS8]|uniref:hypothetical protein n=1 Tax=Paenibacillus sp. RS8 TaxID=3242681 RepID=UPI0035BEF0EF